MSTPEAHLHSAVMAKMPEDRDEALRLLWAIVMDMRMRQDKQMLEDRYGYDYRRRLEPNPGS